MNLLTNIPLISQKFDQIDYKSNLMLLGSCFVENIGSKLDYYKFQNLQNPFGILFHPLAIESFISNVINKKKYTEKDLFFLNERWHCFDTHSKLSSQSKDGLLNNLNTQIDNSQKQINKSSHIIMTLGTAWAYRYIETNKIVSNCHKVPHNKFLKELFTVDEIVESLQSIVALIRSVNKSISILFTVSPIRHLKDGFLENTQSKANLISAVHQVVESRNHIYYFPSYEIMMDELRDYRFYTEDMIHPNITAINYIWEKFKYIWISENAYQTMDLVETIQRGLSHKPFNPESDAHQKFLKNLIEKQKQLQKELPSIKF